MIEDSDPPDPWLPELTPDEAERREYERPGPPIYWHHVAVVQAAEAILAAESDWVRGQLGGTLQADAAAACAASSAATSAAELEEDDDARTDPRLDARDDAAGDAAVDE